MAFDVSESTKRTMTAVAALFSITAAGKSLLWPFLENKLFPPKPAVIIETADVYIDAKPFGYVFLRVTKERPCLPQAAAIVVTRSDKTQTSIKLDWQSPLPIGRSIPTKFYFAPVDVATVDTSKPPQLVVTHAECSDGRDPLYPATAIGQYK